MGQKTRLDVTERVAGEYLAVHLPEETPRIRLRPYCLALIKWILRGGEEPDNRQRTMFTRQIVIEAIDSGLEHAYGDSHRAEIDPQIHQRRSLLS